MQQSSNVIAGHSVEMPHQPYGVQFGFCSKMLQALTGQKNALLEAPTGSGKTLSLLCSALAWQKKLKDDGSVTQQSVFNPELRFDVLLHVLLLGE